MDSNTVGSFSILCRLLRALRKASTTPSSDTMLINSTISPSQKAILQAFLERYATAADHLSALFQLLLADVGTAASTRTTDPAVLTDLIIHSLLLSTTTTSETTISTTVVGTPSWATNITASTLQQFTTNYGTASLADVLSFITTISYPPTSFTQSQKDAIVSFMRRITVEEWWVVSLIATRNIAALYHPTMALPLRQKVHNDDIKDSKESAVGEQEDRLRALFLQTVFGSSAGTLFRTLLTSTKDSTTTSHVDRVIRSVTDGSPRMLRESSFGDDVVSSTTPKVSAPKTIVIEPKRGRDEADDIGFASPDHSEGEEETDIIILDKEPARKVARVEGGMAAAAAPAGYVPVHRGADGRPLCMYGERCRRANPFHWSKYSHPAGCRPPSSAAAVAPPPSSAIPIPGGHHPSPPPAPITVTHPPAPVPSPVTAAVSPSSHAIRGVAPLRVMKEFEFVYPENTGGDYKMKNCGGGTYTCTCPVWRFQNKNTDARTCKHLQAYLGVEFEQARCTEPSEWGTTAAAVTPGSPKKGPAASPSSVIGGKVGMPGVLLANKASEKGNYVGWWVSEKLDGVRAYWDGTHLLSRNGNIFTAPPSFTDAFPKGGAITLDGELFGGRKKFQSTVGIVKSSPNHPGWSSLTYEIFDIPSSGSKPFEERMKELNTMFPKGGPVKHIHVVEQMVCTGDPQLQSELRRVEGLGGEGLMLREPKSKYVHARSNTLLKIKSTEEVDAMVKGHDPGKGKHAGRCGALLVELANGKQFCVGSGMSDAQRNAPPPVGTVVVVRFQELTDGGIPRFPVFVGCRYDIDWAAAKAAAAAAGGV